MFFYLSFGDDGWGLWLSGLCTFELPKRVVKTCRWWGASFLVEWGGRHALVVAGQALGLFCSALAIC